jgi:hypothetical protein
LSVLSATITTQPNERENLKWAKWKNT